MVRVARERPFRAALGLIAAVVSVALLVGGGAASAHGFGAAASRPSASCPAVPTSSAAATRSSRFAGWVCPRAECRSWRQGPDDRAFSRGRERDGRRPDRRPSARQELGSCVPDAAARSCASPTIRSAVPFSRGRSYSRGSASRRRGRAVQPAGRRSRYLYKSSNPAKPGFQAYDPANPPADVAHDDDRQGVTVPFIVRLETGYIDRDQYQIATLFQPGKAWTPVAPAAAVQPQAAHHPRRGLRRGPPDRHARRRCLRRRRDGARARLRGDVQRARQRRPQLQPRDRGRGAGDDEGAPDRALRDAALHDRHRLLGRLAGPAVDLERLPRHLPGDPADVLVPRRVEHRDAVPRLPPDARTTSTTRRAGARA